jgi:selenocysteine lyase/cysteine desulfurase
LIRKVQPLIDESREMLCRTIGADSRDLVFVQNATAGVNAVLRSLEFQPGDEILTTSHEYNACRNVADYVSKRCGAKVIEITLPIPVESPEQVVEAVLSGVTSRTKLAMLDHITSPTAIVFPIEEIVRRLAEKNIEVLVDGAHGPGMVPLDLERFGVAYYTGNCHKWLCTPKTAGFLYVRRDRQEGIMPTVIGHGYNKPRPGYTRFQDLFDWPGTFDPTPWICVGKSIECLSGLLPGGLPALMERNHALAVWARRMFQERLGRTGFQPVNKSSSPDSSAIREPKAQEASESVQKSSCGCAAPIDKLSGLPAAEKLSAIPSVAMPICPESMLGSMSAVIVPFDIGERFDTTTTPTATHQLCIDLRYRHNIEAVIYHYPAPPQALLRVSAQAYNTPEQYERLADVLNGIFAG